MGRRDKLADGFEERVGHGQRLLSGGEAVSQVAPTEGGNASLTGQLGHIGIEIHPVDAFQFHHDVFLLELGQAGGYFHGEFRLGFCSPLLEQPPLVGNIPAPQGAATPNRTHPVEDPMGLGLARPDPLTRWGLRAARHSKASNFAKKLLCLAGLRLRLVSKIAYCTLPDLKTSNR